MHRSYALCYIIFGRELWLMHNIRTHPTLYYASYVYWWDILCIRFTFRTVYDAFEHWKSLVHMLCSSEDAMKSHSKLFSNFICEYLLPLQCNLGYPHPDFPVLKSQKLLKVKVQLQLCACANATCSIVRGYTIL